MPKCFQWVGTRRNRGRIQGGKYTNYSEAVDVMHFKAETSILWKYLRNVPVDAIIPYININNNSTCVAGTILSRKC